MDVEMVPVIVAGCICVIGIIVNGLSLYMFCRGDVKTSTTYQVQWLAGVDMVYLLTRFVFWPFQEAFYAVWGYFPIPFPVLFYILYPVRTVSLGVGVWLTVFIAMYRYLAICKPFSESYRHLERHGQKYAALVVALSTMYQLTHVGLRYLDHHRLITPVYEYKELVFIIDKSVMLNAPLIILTFATVKLIRAVREREKIRRGINHDKTPRDNSIIAILVAILVTFLVCHLPAAINGICVILQSKAIATCPWTQGSVPGILLIVNSTVNGFVYFFGNKDFRRALVGHCRCKRNTQDQIQNVEMGRM